MNIKKFTIFVMILSVLSLTACSNNESNNDEVRYQPIPSPSGLFSNYDSRPLQDAPSQEIP